MPYFDANATTPLSPAARNAWSEAIDTAWQNPSGPYRAGARVHNLLEKAREKLAAILSCEAKQIVFNSGATEGVNTIFSYCASRGELAKRPVLISPFEHPCVVAAARRFFDDAVVEIPGSREGRWDVVAAAEAVRGQNVSLVALMAANNETGVIQPWREIGEICRDAGVPFLCDASQWAGKKPLKGIGEAGFVTASAHKFGGPKGCGFLVVPKNVTDFRGLVGGEQEHGMRAGTENYPAIAAMVAALEECEARLQSPRVVEERLKWRQRFESDVLQRLPGTRIGGHNSERLWNTVFLILPQGANDRWVRKLDRAGFEVSTGSACSWGKDEPSHVLTAIGFSPEESKRAIRVSSGWETTEADWQAMADALVIVAKEMGSGPGDVEVIRL